MALNKLMFSAIKLASKKDLDVKNNYEQTRKIFDISHPPLKGEYNMWEYSVKKDGYEIPVRIFAPEETKPVQAIVFFHGGGWVTGNINSYTNTCSRIARVTNSYVISVDYRLAPENKFPCAVNDCFDTLSLVYERIEDFGLTKDRVYLMGDSAGGNLSAAVSLMARDKGLTVPKKQILIYPATNYDHSPNSPFKSVEENGYDYFLTSKRIRDYLSLYVEEGFTDYHNPYFAPLTAKDFSNQPQTLIITAEFCPLRDEGEYYGEKLREAGNYVEIHRIPDAIHGFITLPPQFKAVRDSFAIINRFLNI